jgi:hypothetical protein
MPEVIDNADGTKTLTVNSNELRAVKDLLDEHAPGVKKVVQALDGPGVRTTLSFVRSAVL